MFEPILAQLKQQLSDVLKSNHQLDQTEADRTAEAAGLSIVEIVKKQVNQKDFSVVNEALSGAHTDTSHPSIQNLAAPLAATLAERTGFDATKSQSIVATLLPFVFNMFNEQVQQAKTQGIDVKDLVQKVASGGLNMANMGAAMSLAKNFMKDKPGKGNIIGDTLSKFF